MFMIGTRRNEYCFLRVSRRESLRNSGIILWNFEDTSGKCSIVYTAQNLGIDATLRHTTPIASICIIVKRDVGLTRANHL